MKKLNIFLSLTFIALLGSHRMHGYSYIMKNNSDKTLLIQVELLYSENAYFNIAKPGQTVDFSWTFGNAMSGFTLEKIKYVIVDDYLLHNADFLNTDKSAVTNPRTAMTWLNKHGNRYTRKEIPIQLLARNKGKIRGSLLVGDKRRNIYGSKLLNLEDENRSKFNFDIIEKKDGTLCALLITDVSDEWCSYSCTPTSSTYEDYLQRTAKEKNDT